MESKIRMWKVMILLGVMLFFSMISFAKDGMYNCLSENKADTSSLFSIDKRVPSDSLFFRMYPYLRSSRFIHRLGVEARPGYIIPTNPFLEGENEFKKPIKSSFSAHLKYSFQFHPNTFAGRIYGNAYQGIGLAYYTFGDRKQLGDPLAVYLFQGARIAQIAPWLSFNYEWNFGLSTGWKPYDPEKNSYNGAIGSKMNAYINADFYLNWRLSRQFDLTSGIALTHFSNGNTKFPNAGLNAVGFQLGLVYNFNRKDYFYSKSLYQPAIAKFPRHISYDLVLFGSWRRKGVVFGEKEIASPGSYPVFGFNFSPMYNVGYKFRMGVSADGVYDGSANVYTEDYIVDYGGNGTGNVFLKPKFKKQLALGFSGRLEYVMPYFTVGIGMGTNVIHGGGDLKGFYQILALKIEVTRSSFIHIGYNLQNFQTPNYLMLGIGFRFNNKYPTCHR